MAALMMDSAIFAVICADSQPLAALAFFESMIQIWDLFGRIKVVEFESVLEGPRLALSANGDRCFAASWSSGSRGGVAAYNSFTGDRLWHRSGLRETQKLRLSASGESIWCVADSGDARLLSVSDGEELCRLTGVRSIIEIDGLRLIESRTGVILSRAGRNVSLTEHSILSAAHSESEVVISEFGAQLRCFDKDGVELWAVDPGEGAHFTKVFFSKTMDLFYAVLKHYNGGSDLYAIDQQSGDAVKIADTGSWAYDISDVTRSLITAHGDAIDLASGLRSSVLNVPQMEYPNRQ